MEDPNLQGPGSNPSGNNEPEKQEPISEPASADQVAETSSQPAPVEPSASTQESASSEPVAQQPEAQEAPTAVTEAPAEQASSGGFNWQKLGVIGLVIAVVAVFSYFATTTLFKGDLFGIEADNIVHNPEQIEEFFPTETDEFYRVEIADEDKTTTHFGEDLVYNTVDALDDIHLQGQLDNWFRTKVDIVSSLDDEAEQKAEIKSIITEVFEGIDVSILGANYEEGALIVAKSETAKLKSKLFKHVPDHVYEKFNQSADGAAANVLGASGDFEILEFALDKWDPEDDIKDGATELSITAEEQTHGPHTLSGVNNDLHDIFRFNLDTGKTYVFSTKDIKGTVGDAKIVMGDTNCSKIPETTVPVSEGAFLKYSPTENGTHCLAVSHHAAETDLEYNLAYYVTGTNPVYIPDAYEPDNTVFDIDILDITTAPQSQDHTLSATEDPQDWYQLDLDATHTYKFTTTNVDAEAAVVTMKIASGNCEEDVVGTETTVEENAELEFTSPDTALYCLKITHNNPGVELSSYTLNYQDITDPNGPEITKFDIFYADEDGNKGVKLINNDSLIYEDQNTDPSFIIEWEVDNFIEEQHITKWKITNHDTGEALTEFGLPAAVSGSEVFTKQTLVNVASQTDTIDIQLIVTEGANVVAIGPVYTVRLVAQPSITAFKLYAANEDGSKGAELLGGEELPYKKEGTEPAMVVEFNTENFVGGDAELQLQFLNPTNGEEVYHIPIEDQTTGDFVVYKSNLYYASPDSENEGALEVVDFQLKIVGSGDLLFAESAEIYEDFTLVHEKDGDEWDPGDDSFNNTPTPITIEDYLQYHGPHTINATTDTHDWFEVDLEAGNGYKFTVPAVGSVTEIRIYAASNKFIQLASEIAGSNDLGKDLSIEWTAPADDTYYVGVHNIGNNTYEYNFAYQNLTALPHFELFELYTVDDEGNETELSDGGNLYYEKGNNTNVGLKLQWETTDFKPLIMVKFEDPATGEIFYYNGLQQKANQVDSITFDDLADVFAPSSIPAEVNISLVIAAGEPATPEEIKLFVESDVISNVKMLDKNAPVLETFKLDVISDDDQNLAPGSTVYWKEGSEEISFIMKVDKLANDANFENYHFEFNTVDAWDEASAKELADDSLQFPEGVEEITEAYSKTIVDYAAKVFAGNYNEGDTLYMRVVIIDSQDEDIAVSNSIALKFQEKPELGEPIINLQHVYDESGAPLVEGSGNMFYGDASDEFGFRVAWNAGGDIPDNSVPQVIFSDANDASKVVILDLPNADNQWFGSETYSLDQAHDKIAEIFEDFDGDVPAKLNVQLQIIDADSLTIAQSDVRGPFNFKEIIVPPSGDGEMLKIHLTDGDNNVLSLEPTVFYGSGIETSFHLNVNKEILEGHTYLLQYSLDSNYGEDGEDFAEGKSEINFTSQAKTYSYTDAQTLFNVMQTDLGVITADDEIYWRLIVKDENDVIVDLSPDISVFFDELANKGQKDFTITVKDTNHEKITAGSTVEYEDEDIANFMYFEWTVPGLLSLDSEMDYGVGISPNLAINLFPLHPNILTDDFMLISEEGVTLDSSNIQMSINQQEFYDTIQSAIQSGKIKFPENPLQVYAYIKQGDDVYYSNNYVSIIFDDVTEVDPGGGPDLDPEDDGSIETRTSCILEENFCVVQYEEWLLIGNSTEITNAIERINDAEGNLTVSIAENEAYSSLLDEMTAPIKALTTWFFHHDAISGDATVLEYLPSDLEVEEFVVKGFLLANGNFNLLVDLPQATILDTAKQLLVNKLNELGVIERITEFLNEYIYVLEQVNPDPSVVIDVILHAQADGDITDTVEDYLEEAEIDDGPVIPEGFDQWDPQDDTIDGASNIAPSDAEKSHGPHTIREGDPADWFMVSVPNDDTRYELYSDDVTGNIRFNLYSNDESGQCTKPISTELSSGSSISKILKGSQFEGSTACLEVVRATLDTDATYTLKFKIKPEEVNPPADGGSNGGSSGGGGGGATIGGGGTPKHPKNKVNVTEPTGTTGTAGGTPTETDPTVDQIANVPEVSLTCLHQAEDKIVFQDRPANPESLEAKAIDFLASVASMPTGKGKNEAMSVGYPVAVDFPDLRLFKPLRDISRAEFLKLAQIANCKYTIDGPVASDFPDTTDHWGKNLIKQAVSNGVVSGYLDGSFGPNDPVTRSQAIKILMEIKGTPLQAHDPALYADVKQGDWFAQYVSTAYHEGLFDGMTQFNLDEFKPDKSISRVETAMLIYNMFNYIFDAQKAAGLIEEASLF